MAVAPQFGARGVVNNDGGDDAEEVQGLGV